MFTYSDRVTCFKDRKSADWCMGMKFQFVNKNTYLFMMSSKISKDNTERTFIKSLKIRKKDYHP